MMTATKVTVPWTLRRFGLVVDNFFCSHVCHCFHDLISFVCV